MPPEGETLVVSHLESFRLCLVTESAETLSALPIEITVTTDRGTLSTIAVLP